MALKDSLRHAKDGFARLSVAKKALAVAVGILMIAGLSVWFVGANSATPRAEDSAWTVEPTSAEESAAVSAATSATTAADQAALGGTGANADAAVAKKKPAPTAGTPDTADKPDATTPSKKPSADLSESTVGLTEAQRKTIALEIIAMEKRATEEANAKYPTDAAANERYWGELDAQYKADLMAKYKLSMDQLLFIVVVDVPQYSE